MDGLSTPSLPHNSFQLLPVLLDEPCHSARRRRLFGMGGNLRVGRPIYIVPAMEERDGFDIAVLLLVATTAPLAASPVACHITLGRPVRLSAARRSIFIILEPQRDATNAIDVDARLLLGRNNRFRIWEEVLLSPTSERLIRAAPRFIPRPRPSSSELRRDECMRRLAMPGQMLRALWDFGESAEDLPAEVRTRVRALGAMLRWKASSASETPLNGSVCPHRIVDWAAMPLAQVQAICKQLGCSLNDVVLGIVTTALRAFMLRRRVDPATLDFRVGAPVDIRPKGERGMGNHVSSWVLRLPLGEESPRQK